MFRVNADLAIVEKMLEATGLGARDLLSEAIDRSCEGVNLLWTASRNVWGDREAQQHRKDYVESSLRAATASSTLRLSNQSKMEWLDLKKTAFPVLWSMLG